MLTFLTAGTRGRVQRSVRNHKCPSRQVDASADGGTGSDVCLAIDTPQGFLHQAEAHLICSPDTEGHHGNSQSDSELRSCISRGKEQRYLYHVN